MTRSFADDGTPLHSSLQNASLTGRSPAFSILGILEAVVLRAYYKDENGNRSKKWTEYDIMEVTRREIYHHCRTVSGLGGLQNSIEVSLSETTGSSAGPNHDVLIIEGGAITVPGARVPDFKSATAPTPTHRMNGERVLFTCLNGAREGAVIIGILPNPNVTQSATRAQAPRLREQFNGWVYEYLKDGALEFKHKDGQRITFTKDGDVEVVPKTGRSVTLGVSTNGGVEAVGLGDSIHTFMTQVKIWMDTHTHPVPGITPGILATTSSVPGAPSPGVPDVTSSNVRVKV